MICKTPRELAVYDQGVLDERERLTTTFKVRIAELEDAIRGVILCTKEPGGACVCIQYAETILNKK